MDNIPHGDAPIFTEMKSALEESDLDFRMLSEALPQIVWITRADGSNIYFNQRWMSYTGLTLEESLGDGWIRPFHPTTPSGHWTPGGRPPRLRANIPSSAVFGAPTAFMAGG